MENKDLGPGKETAYKSRNILYSRIVIAALVLIIAGSLFILALYVPALTAR